MDTLGMQWDVGLREYRNCVHHRYIVLDAQPIPDDASASLPTAVCWMAGFVW